MNITKLAIFKKIKMNGGGTAILEGDGQNYHQFAPTALTFRSTEPLEEFKEVQVNGETVDPENYTLEEGSTIVTLKPEYLKTLGGGKYEIAIVSQNKTTSGKFDVTVPQLNEYGFYYNQPYVGYVAYYGKNWVFFFREDGTLDFMILGSDYLETCPYTIENGIITVNGSQGVFTASATTEGVYCNELATAFVLGNESIAADEDYVYVYNEELGGYEVNVIDKTKAEYGAIKTGINGIDTVKLVDAFLTGNDNGTTGENSTLIVIPQIPNTVTTIGRYAFYKCTQIENIEIPASVTKIDDTAFSGCTSLKRVTFAEGSQLTTIESLAFEDCISLDGITIPASVKHIGSYVFGDCSSLTNITISDSVTIIASGAFCRCTSLTDIIYEGTMAQWNAITKQDKWNFNVPATYVQCTDGQVSLV